MNYDNVKFHEVLFALEIRGWKIPTAPETEEYFLDNLNLKIFLIIFRIFIQVFENF